MSQQAGIIDLTFVAGTDLTTKQYRVVKMAGSGTPMGVILPTSAAEAAAQTDVQIGVLQNEPAVGEAAVIRIEGTTKVITASPVAIGAYLTSGTPAGSVRTAVTDKDFVIGIALETGAATGDIIEILLTHFKASI